MTRAREPFRRIQVSNPENTPGSAEAAVEILHGKMNHKYSDQEWFYPEEERNRLSLHNSDHFKVGVTAELSFEAEMYDRLGVWLFASAIRGNVTQTQPDVGPKPLEYEWVFEPSLTGTGNTPDETDGIDTFTFEFGDNVQAYEVAFASASAIEISGAPNEPCKVTWEMFGDKLVETTFTPALSDVIAKYFPYNLAKFYIDANYAAIGTTVKTDALKAFRFRLETMFTPRYASDGTFVLSGVNEAKKSVELELTFWRDSLITEIEKDLYDTAAQTYIRVELIGEDEIDAGQANPPRIFLDGSFIYTDWPEADAEDGHVVETVTLQSSYDSVAAKEFGVTVRTPVAAYPV